MTDSTDVWSSHDSPDHVGIVFVCRGAALLVSTPTSFSDPRWWPPTLERRRSAHVEVVLDRVRETVDAPPAGALQPLGVTEYVNDDGVRGACSLYVQQVRDRWHLPSRYAGVLWRPLVGRPVCPGIDELIVRALTGSEPNLALVIQAHHLFSMEQEADTSALQGATAPNPEWATNVVTRLRQRSELVADMPKMQTCRIGELGPDDGGQR
jgi:hypothetical protein